MIFGGLQKFSAIDYPGKTCAIVFTVGCNFRCPFCHNPEIVAMSENTNVIPEEEIFEFLGTRRGKLDAVSITGGEPTLHKGLFDFMQKIKDMGFLVKLDSNGTRPNVLKETLERKLVDYLAMDIKAPFEKYEKITTRPVDIQNIKESIKIVKNSKIDYEFRTTVVKSLLSKEDILKIGKIAEGAKSFYLQKFVSTKTHEPNYLNAETYTDEEFEEMQKEISKLVDFCGIR